MRINSCKRNILLLLAGIGLSGIAAPNGPVAPDLGQNLTGLIGQYVGPVYDFRRNDPDSTQVEIIQRRYSFEICPPEQHGPRKSRLKLTEELSPLAELSTEQREELTQKIGCPTFETPISDVFLIALDRARDEMLGLNQRHLAAGHILSLNYSALSSQFCGFRRLGIDYSGLSNKFFGFRSLGTNYMLEILWTHTPADLITLSLPSDSDIVGTNNRLYTLNLSNRNRDQLQEWFSHLNTEYTDYLYANNIELTNKLIGETKHKERHAKRAQQEAQEWYEERKLNIECQQIMQQSIQHLQRHIQTLENQAKSDFSTETALRIQVQAKPTATEISPYLGMAGVFSWAFVDLAYYFVNGESMSGLSFFGAGTLRQSLISLCYVLSSYLGCACVIPAYNSLEYMAKYLQRRTAPEAATELMTESLHID